jgi:predicted RNA-binding protein with EMAP domain
MRNKINEDSIEIQVIVWELISYFPHMKNKKKYITVFKTRVK